MLQPQYPNRLFYLRKRMSLSQKQVLSIIGQKDRTMLSKYERGHVIPSLSVAAKFEALYEVSVADMFPRLFSQCGQPVRTTRDRLLRTSPTYIN